jgi:hypothetical protein
MAVRSDVVDPLFDRKPQSAHDSACRHSLRRSLLARRRPGRQFLCDNPVGDELAEAGAPADLIDDRAAVGAEGRRSEQWIDKNRRERLQGGAADEEDRDIQSAVALGLSATAPWFTQLSAASNTVQPC